MHKSSRPRRQGAEHVGRGAGSLRFAAVISHPIQHYSPVFRELAQRDGVEVKVFYLRDHGVRESYDEGFGASFAWDIPLTDGYNYEFLRPGFKPRKGGFMEMDYPGLSQKLDEYAPDLIWLHGYAHRMCWRALGWAKKNGAATVYFGDSELLHKRSVLARLLKKLVLPVFFSRCDRFITIGDNNEAYYRHYGVSEDKMVRAACPVDMRRFMLAPEIRSEWRREVRESLGIAPQDIVILFSGKLQDYKRPQDLMRAVAQVGRPGLHAVYIGDGPMRPCLESEVTTLGLRHKVHFTGFINQADIPRYMSAGDIMAVTSERDAHPLVVSEALPFGMPIIASDKVGSVGPTDTARPGVNALTYRSGEIAGLAGVINRFLDDVEFREQCGRASLEIAPTQDTSVTVDAVLMIGTGLPARSL